MLMSSLPFKVDLETYILNGIMGTDGYLYLDMHGHSFAGGDHEFPTVGQNNPLYIETYDGYSVNPTGESVFHIGSSYNPNTNGNSTNATATLNTLVSAGVLTADPLGDRGIRDVYPDNVVNALAYLWSYRYSGMFGMVNGHVRFKLPKQWLSDLGHIPIMTHNTAVCRVNLGCSEYSEDALKKAVKDPKNISFGYLFSEMKLKDLLSKGWDGLTHKFRTHAQLMERADQIYDVISGGTFPGRVIDNRAAIKDISSVMVSTLRTYFDKYVFKSGNTGKKKLLLLSGDDICKVYMHFGCNSCMTGCIPQEYWAELGAPNTKEFQNRLRTEAYSLSPNAEIALLIEADKEEEVRKLLKSVKKDVTNTTSNLNKDNMILARCMVWRGRNNIKYYDRLYPSNTLGSSLISTRASNQLVELMKQAGIEQLREGEVTAGGSFTAKHIIECDLKVARVGTNYFTLPYMDTMRFGVLLDDDTLRVSVNKPKGVEDWQIYPTGNSKCVHRIQKLFVCPVSGKKGRTGTDSRTILLATVKNHKLEFEEVDVHTSCINKEVVLLARAYGNKECWALKAHATQAKISKSYFLINHMPDGVVWCMSSGVAARIKDTVKAIVSIDANGRCVYGMERKDFVTDMHGKPLFDKKADKNHEKMTHEPEDGIILSGATVTPAAFAKSAKGRTLEALF